METATEIFETYVKTVTKLFGDADSYYEIPDYQRPYNWEDKEIEQLWDDIYDAYTGGVESYFLGPIILIKTDKRFEIVDGQQRLTTLMIFFCVLRDLYLKNNKKLSNMINSLSDDEYRLKLITQLNNQNQFENEILNKVKFPPNKMTKKEKQQNKFLNSACILRDKLKSIKKDEIEKFSEFIFNKIVFITISCYNRGSAIKLFQVLNTRGMDLSNADLIKSNLIHKIEQKYGHGESTQRKQFNATWNKIESITKKLDEEVCDIDITDLFTYYAYYIFGRNLKKSLYEELDAQFKNEDPNKIIFEFQNFVEKFNSIVIEESKLINSFWYLPNQIYWRSILTAAKFENYKFYNDLCKDIRKFYYSYWLAGYTISKTKQISYNIIVWIKQKKHIDFIKNKLNQKMKEDGVFNRIKENINGDAYNNIWIKPTLLLIEYEQTDDSKITFINAWDKSLHADHILPVKWESIPDWKNIWNQNSAMKYLNTIGNLTLISGKKNIAASNSFFDKKKKIYEGKGKDGITAFEISKNILKYKQWTEKEVIDRHDWIISQLEKILDIKFR